MTGFVLVSSGNTSAGNALIICGSLVGASGYDTNTNYVQRNE